MSAEQRLSYVDSSAIVKLAVAEPESNALRRYLACRDGLVSSALASARRFGASVRQIITYDERMADAARASGWAVVSPR
jgi:predicted nucleic acid-binding protein